MYPREFAAPGKLGPLRVTACLWLALVSGCVSLRPHMDEVMWASQVSRPREVAEQYRVGCPDVLTIFVDDPTGRQQAQIAIGVDGRIDLGERGRVRVEGGTSAEAAAVIASQLGLPAAQVQVEVADYRSQKVYIFGQVAGLERAVPFRGEETVLELLQRAGGITPGAAPNEVYVIRAHVAQGGRPEVFPVKLQEIIVKHDPKTNVTLEPFDQIYVGETRRSSYGKCLPPILRPLYEGLVGLYRSSRSAFGKHAAGAERQPESEPIRSAHLPMPNPLTGAD